MPRILFLEWRPHNRRAEALAKDLGARLWLPAARLRRKSLAPVRYTLLAFQTVKVLLSTRPDIVIVTSPPSFGPIIVFLYSRLMGTRYVIDAHHLATTGLWSRVPFGYSFNRFIMRNAAVTLVHNQLIETMARREGIPAITLETKIPRIADQPASVKRDQALTVFTPCSFDSDEPIAAIYEAALSLPAVTFHLTGNPNRLDSSLRKAAPGNVNLTGFLTQEEYDRLLVECDIVLATTTNDYPVRPRAASEAIAAEKPLVASRNPATQDHLGDAAILIQNTSSEIIRAVQEIQADYALYQERMAQLKKARRLRYEAELDQLKRLLQWTPGTPIG